MKSLAKLFVCLVLLGLALPASAQTSLGKSPVDQFQPGFFFQNNNLQKILDAIAAASRTNGGFSNMIRVVTPGSGATAVTNADGSLTISSTGGGSGGTPVAAGNGLSSTNLNGTNLVALSGFYQGQQVFNQGAATNVPLAIQGNPIGTTNLLDVSVTGTGIHDYFDSGGNLHVSGVIYGDGSGLINTGSGPIALTGDVTGTTNATVVATVGGIAANQVASKAVVNTASNALAVQASAIYQSSRAFDYSQVPGLAVDVRASTIVGTQGASFAIWTNSQGNGINLTNGLALAPTIQTNTFGFNGLQFNASSSFLASPLLGMNGSSNYAIYIVYKRPTPAGASYFTLGGIGFTNSSGIEASNYVTVGSNYIAPHWSTPTSLAMHQVVGTGGFSAADDTAITILTYLCSNGTNAFYVDGFGMGDGNYPDARPVSGQFILGMNANFTQYFDGQIFDVKVYTNMVSYSDNALINRALYDTYLKGPIFVGCGDSVLASGFAPAVSNIVWQLAQYYGGVNGQINFVNLSIGNKTGVSPVVGGTPHPFDRTYDWQHGIGGSGNKPRSPNFLLEEWISNDINAGLSLTALEMGISNLCVLDKKNGSIVGLTDVIPRNTNSLYSNPGFEATRVAYNTWLAANWTNFADVFIQLTADPLWSDPLSWQNTNGTTATYGPDGVHPTLYAENRYSYLVFSGFRKFINLGSYIGTAAFHPDTDFLTPTGSGSGLTSLNGANVTTGTLLSNSFSSSAVTYIINCASNAAYHGTNGFGNIVSHNSSDFYPTSSQISATNISGLGWVPVEALGITGGTNDNTAAWNVAAQTGLTLVLTKPLYTLYSNVFFTNGTSLIGNGANVISVAASVTNSAITVQQDNFRFRDFHVEGNYIAFEGNGDDSYSGQSTGPHAWKYYYSSDPANRFASNSVDWQRNGLEVYSEKTNSFVDNIYIHAFSGSGLILNGNNRVGLQPTNSLVSFTHIQSVENYKGIFAYNGSEYTTVSDWHCYMCGIACYVGSGNVNWIGGEAERNCLAVYLDGDNTGTSNPLHGEFTGCRFNHNDLTVYGYYSSFAESFTGCYALGGGAANVSGHQGPTFYFKQFSGFNWEGGNMAPTDMKFDGNASGQSGSLTAYNRISCLGTYNNPACNTTIINNAFVQLEIWPNDSTNAVMTNNFGQVFLAPVSGNFTGTYSGIVANGLGTAISAVTNFVVDLSKPNTYVSMATAGVNINLAYCTNWNSANYYQEALFQIKGDATHALSFAVPTGETITQLGLATNGVIPGASNGLFQLAVSHLKIPGTITNTTYALVPPAN